MTGGGAVRRRLAAQGARPVERLALLPSALLLGSLDRPDADRQAARRAVRRMEACLGRILADRAEPAGGDERARALCAALTESGLAGDVDTYDDLDNGNLVRVLERGKGLPVALGILFIHLGRTRGWPTEGLNFPGHFLTRVDGAAGDRVVVDPFNDGRILSIAELRSLLKSIHGEEAELQPEHHAPLDNRAILLRLHNNIKIRRLKAGELDLALKAMEEMLLIAPESPTLWREAGLTRLRLGNVIGACDAISEYLTRAPAGPERLRMGTMLDELRGRLH